MEETKKFVFIRSLVKNYFQADTILLGGMGVKKKKFQALCRKAFYICKNFTLVITYFIIATAFAFYCNAEHSDVLQGSSHVRCDYFYEDNETSFTQ